MKQKESSTIEISNLSFMFENLIWQHEINIKNAYRKLRRMIFYTTNVSGIIMNPTSVENHFSKYLTSSMNVK